jgi:hypothetical protein
VKDKATENTKRVRCSDLSERCYGRPQWSPMLALEAKIGGFVLFEDEEASRGGVIMEIVEDVAHVHEYVANEKRSRWVPVWVHDSGREEPKQKAPGGAVALMRQVEWEQVLLVGKIKGMVLADDTKRRALAMGLTWALPLGYGGAGHSDHDL